MENFSEKAWFNAVVNNDLAQVKLLLDQGADANAQLTDSGDWTPLQIATFGALKK